MIDLYIVYIANDKPRKGAPQNNIAGAFTSEDIANSLAGIVSGTVTKVVLNEVHPGHRAYAKSLGIQI